MPAKFDVKKEGMVVAEEGGERHGVGGVDEEENATRWKAAADGWETLL